MASCFLGPLSRDYGPQKLEHDLKFTDLNLREDLLKAICQQGYDEPTEIQAQAIPKLLDTQDDFVGQAQTGTGKTAAFVLPLLQRLDFNKKGLQALILTPTRELANQVDVELKKLGQYSKSQSVVIYGGASYDKQISELKRKSPQVVVGTPGRVIDLMERGVLKFQEADYLILDEADEMLKMGFFEDVQTILKSFNKQRRMWMFSATMPEPILRLVRSEFRNPTVVKLKMKTLSNADIEQRYYVVDQRQRREALYRLIQVEDDMYGIVFCRTRVETKELSSYLIERGIKVESLSGELSQSQREYTMARFRTKKVNLLVCTDVAARGIDINDLTHVFNYGLPQDMDSYVHRIGRTGRAGSKGIAATLVDPRDMGFLRRIEKLTKSEMKRSTLPSVKEMKEQLISQNMERMQAIKKVVQEKGENFDLDSSFEIFSDFFSSTSKDEIEKIMFTFMFNRDLIRLDEMGDIKVETTRRNRPRHYGPREGGNERSGSRAGRAGRKSSPRGRSSNAPKAPGKRWNSNQDSQNRQRQYS